jgi:hypothetical protein
MLGLGERMVAPALHPADLLAGKAFAEHVLAHQVLVRAEHVGLVLDLPAQIPQHFHGALVGDVRARRIGQPAVAVDRHVLDPVGRQQRRRRRTGRAGANDQDVGLISAMIYSSFDDGGVLARQPPVRRRRTGNSSMPVRSENRPQSPRGANSMMAMPMTPSAIRYQLP